MAVENLFQGATVRDRFVSAVARNDETAAQRLTSSLPGPEDPHAQRDEAWELLSADVQWAAEALKSVGITGTDASPIRDSDTAFERAQHLDRQLWQLGQRPGFHDAVALLVESVKRACYRGAELGPIPGGRRGSFVAPGDSPRIVEPVEPDLEDLRGIGSDSGEALRWYAELGLGDAADEAIGVLSGDAHSA